MINLPYETESVCLTITNLNSVALKTWCLTIPLDILTIYSPSIIRNLRIIFIIYCQRNFSWTKQRLQRNFFPWFKYKRYRQWLIQAFTTNTQNSDCLSSISPVWVVMYGVDISQLIRFSRCWTSILHFHSKILKSLQNKWTRVKDITSFKNICKVLQAILWAFIEILWDIVSRIYFWRSLSTGLLEWSNLQTKEGQRRSKFRLVEARKC